jgi:hypothetical protein
LHRILSSLRRTGEQRDGAYDPRILVLDQMIECVRERVVSCHQKTSTSRTPETALGLASVPEKATVRNLGTFVVRPGPDGYRIGVVAIWVLPTERTSWHSWQSATVMAEDRPAGDP